MLRLNLAAGFFALLAVAAPAAAHAQQPAQDSVGRGGTPPRAALPLVTTRTVKFTTDEGTWMSLDVSPDGQTIVFDLVGDLYTLPISGGKATRITDGPAIDAQPRFSPDGKTIVFASDRSGGENLWFINPDGKNARALTRGDKNQYVSPVWAPDGSGIVVSRATDPVASTYSLYFFHKDGGSGLQLLGAPPTPPAAAPAGGGRGGAEAAPNNYVGAAFGKDPRYLYVPARTGGFGYNQTTLVWTMYRLDRETMTTDVAARSPGSAMRPILSPDGKYLIYATRSDTSTHLRIRELETGDERWFLKHVQHDDQESRWTRDLMPGSGFLRDGSAMIMFDGGKIWRVDVPSGKKTNIPFTAEVEQRLGPLSQFQYPVNDTTLTVQQIRDAHPSPDGRRLVFTAVDRLWTMDLPNGTPKRLTTSRAGEFDPAWSPDGSHIAYVTWTDSGGHLMRIRGDGSGQPQQLSRRVAFYARPGYSPSGSRIVVTMGPRAGRMEDAINAGPSDLVWFPAAGGPHTRIAAGGGGGGGGTPYFVRGDTTRIYLGSTSMTWEGTDRRTHFTVTGGTPIIAPNGERAIARVRNNIYLFTVPMAGATPPTIAVDPPSGSPVPARQATRISGEFLGWAPDSKSFHYSLGRHFFRYDLTRSDSAVTDSITRAEATAQAGGGGGRGGGGRGGAAGADSTRGRAIYEPEHLEIRIQVPKDRPSGAVALRGARIITMKGREIIENGDIVIQGNRILGVGARGKVTIPSNARVMDVKGKTIIPGFVDIHWHGGQDGGEHKTELWNYWATLAFGTTTTRNPQTGSTDVLSYSDMVETGEMIGPRIYSTGPGVFATDRITNLEQARDVMRRYSEYYDTKTLKQYDAGERKVRQWIIQAAYEQKISPTNENYLDLKKNISQILDGYAGNEHSYPIYPLYKDLVQLHAESGTTYTPTLIVNFGAPWGEIFYYQNYPLHNDPKVRRFIPHSVIDSKVLRRTYGFDESAFNFRQQAEQAAKIVAAGGRVGLGAHGQFNGPGAHWELWMLQSGGMPRHDALRAATTFGADAIGLGKDVGSLEAGKLADLQVLDRNPLDDIKNSMSIKWVMKNGRLYDGNTLDELWPRQVKRKVWFEDQ